MEFKKLFTDDSAVSPVIGVILMVAITVILAAVIGTFVLNLGGSIQNTAPQASFSFDYESGGDNVTITHQTGDTLQSSQIRVNSTDGSLNDIGDDWPSEISAGASNTYNTTTGSWSGQTLRVVWESETGDTSATLSQSTAPGA